MLLSFFLPADHHADGGIFLLRQIGFFLKKLLYRLAFFVLLRYNETMLEKEGGMVVYVIADIHGNSRRFQSILAQIALQPEDKLYILGDVIDRHGNGIRILRQLMAMPNAHMLLGNHEYMMLRALNEPYEPDDQPNLEECRFIWYRNGGDVTHRYWKRIRKTLRAEVIAYLKGLPLNLHITVGDRKFCLVHGAPLEAFQYNQDRRYPTAPHFAVWKRLESQDILPSDETLIFGHTPTKYYQSADPLRIYHGEGRIGIDCGSGFPDIPEDAFTSHGRLACLRLDDMREFYSEEPDLSAENGH